MNKSILFLILVVIIIGVLSCTEKTNDDTVPTITLKGDTLFFLNLDSVYHEPGYTAVDDVDGDISLNVKVGGSIDVHTEGSYSLRYNVNDEAGNRAEEKIRIVRVLQFK